VGIAVITAQENGALSSETMTKREAIAAEILSEMCGSRKYAHVSFDKCARYAIRQTDELLSQLAETPEEARACERADILNQRAQDDRYTPLSKLAEPS